MDGAVKKEGNIHCREVCNLHDLLDFMLCWMNPCYIFVVWDIHKDLGILRLELGVTKIHTILKQK